MQFWYLGQGHTWAEYALHELPVPSPAQHPYVCIQIERFDALSVGCNYFYQVGNLVAKIINFVYKQNCSCNAMDGGQ